MQTDNDKFNVIKDNVKNVLMMLDEVNICLFCKFPYKMKTSIGQLMCQRHPCTYNHALKMFECCGAGNPRKKGCVKCDHNFTGAFKSLSMNVPLWYYHHGHIKKAPTDSLIEIVRHDNEDGTLNLLKTIFKIKVSD